MSGAERMERLRRIEALLIQRLLALNLDLTASARRRQELETRMAVTARLMDRARRLP